MSPKVTTIPATKPLTHGNLSASSRQAVKRVAAYARVSTDMEEQQSSYTAQVDYYTRHITTHTGWQLVRVYTDEGISGTSTKHRAGFQQMITDALSGKIDLILTKSVSRFARNTVDTLTHVRQLKDARVEVYFEKENIWTLDSKGELLITIMSSLAQEESRSISENVTWGHRKRFADGKVMVPYASLLGYKKGEDGNLVIDETQAPIVRRIYANYLAGQSPARIAKTLTADQVPTPRGKTTWTTTTVRSILTNEKYKGDALLQKSFTVDFLTKKTKPNQGEVPQYYVTGSHEPIIDPAVWDRVQTELAARSQPGSSSIHPFASKIKCGQCGGWYGRKTWHSGSKYAKHIWRCNHKYEGKKTGCSTPHVTEKQIQQAFEDALTQRLNDTRPVEEILAHLEKTVFNTEPLKTQLTDITTQVSETEALMNQLITTAATTRLDPDEYDHRYAKLTARHAHLTEQHDHISKQITDRAQRLAQARQAVSYLATQQPLTYSDQIWMTLINHATIHTDGHIEIRFKDEN
ncbi:recombinase family protein [Gleimia hominis]|uniref:Recombinase family protein n=1 Tax=Gleimia hominis TaxID=595468 RepID=A0ABU3ICP9_9ACTO|nr:recombinase family protein [Gleimia hominis]MDT3768150.1 recombinase family protein [Gleimia hominis]